MLRSAYRKAVVGLGNPGIQYQWTLHNLGFLAIDHYLANYGKSHRKRECKFSQAFAVRGALVAKPQTFMNRSGLAVAEICVDFGISPESLLVVYDDYALPFGTVRVRKQGGAGGHNGMASIIDVVGRDDIPRLRLGIADEGAHDELSDYVLGVFSDTQERELPSLLDKAADVIDCFLRDGIETAMNRFNG